MSVKGGPAMVANGYIFPCNNDNWGFKSRHYTCEGRSCPVWLKTERQDLVQTIKSKHTCIMPNTTIARLIKWYLVQVMPTSKYLPATQLNVLACKYLSPTNLKRVPTHTQLVRFVSDRRQASNVKIVNSSPLETQAQERDSNPGPGSLRATRPMDCWTTCPCFLGIKPVRLV
ncbi:hypothetical protein DSO57_1008690 [Entomophthora muscae]|uniref:Uncharacterized protein n=1 Tax=Entomophthora muscae TaxID=34485 RepID=A0ACC2U511_9FUNG|nr:hypothetical protein DSO57_1008690 [Entomophthora muscae]